MALSQKLVVDEAEGSDWYSSGHVSGYEGGGRKSGMWDVIAVSVFVEGIRLEGGHQGWLALLRRALGTSFVGLSAL